MDTKKEPRNDFADIPKEREILSIKNQYGVFCPRCWQRQNDYYGIRNYCPACGQKLGLPK